MRPAPPGSTTASSVAAPLLPPATIDELRAEAPAVGPATACQIVYWGLIDWEGLTHRPQILATELARHYRVLYVRPAPLSRLLSERRPLPPAVQRADDRLVVLRPRALSPGRLRPLGRLNEALATRQIRATLRPDLPTVLWLSHPDQAGQIGEVELALGVVAADLRQQFP